MSLSWVCFLSPSLSLPYIHTHTYKCTRTHTNTHITLYREIYIEKLEIYIYILYSIIYKLEVIDNKIIYINFIYNLKMRSSIY